MKSEDIEEWCKVWRKTDFQIWHEEFGEFSPNHSNIRKFHYFTTGLFFSKEYEIWAKKIQRSYLSWHWTVMQNWNINPDLVVLKMAWGIGWTFIRAPKALKNCTLMGSFCSKHIMFQLENFRGIVCHETENFPKFNGKLTCNLKNDINNLVNFHASSKKSESFHCDRILLSKAYKDLDEKKTEELCFMRLKSNAKFEEKLSLGSKNDMSYLVTFIVSSSKSENLQFDQLLLSIAYKVSAKKVQKNYLSWHWKKIQTLKKNGLFIWKMRRGIWWNLTWVVQSLKIFTLMWYFCRKYVIFELKRYRGIVLWKMTYGFKNDISNLVNFHISSWK